jgi:hypothetical protein
MRDTGYGMRDTGYVMCDMGYAIGDSSQWKPGIGNLDLGPGLLDFA